MHEANVDPLYFEFIAYQLKNESDALIFNNKLHTFNEDHPQYVINHKYREDELHQFLFLLKKES